MPFFIPRKRQTMVLVAILLMAGAGSARDKSKGNLPANVLQARTVSILIDPQAGIDVRDPQANRTAQRNVEAAFLNWGRIQPTIVSNDADLLIVVRKESGRIANATIAGPAQNRRQGVIEPADSGIFLGAQHGSPTGATSNNAAPT